MRPIASGAAPGSSDCALTPLVVLFTSGGHRLQGTVHSVFRSTNDAPCDLCAHDSEAGERLAGENFPSGSPYPPLHAAVPALLSPYK